jgi:hypothetical protein
MAPKAAWPGLSRLGSSFGASMPGYEQSRRRLRRCQAGFWSHRILALLAIIFVAASLLFFAGGSPYPCGLGALVRYYRAKATTLLAGISLSEKEAPTRRGNATGASFGRLEPPRSGAIHRQC